MRTTVLSLIATCSLLAGMGAGCERSDAKAAPTTAPMAGTPTPVPSAVTTSYKIQIKPVGTYKKGQAGVFEILLETKGEYHVNEDYPTKFKASEGPGVTYAKDKLERAKDADAFTFTKCASGKDNCTLSLKVSFTPTQTGSVKVGGTVNFGVCTAATCLIEKQTLELSATVS